MHPALVGMAIAGQLIEMADLQLTDERLQHRIRHVQRVFEKGAEKAGGGELQRKAQPVMAPALGANHGMIRVIQLKIAGQLVGAGVAHIPAIMGTLFGGLRIEQASNHSWGKAEKGKNCLLAASGALQSTRPPGMT